MTNEKIEIERLETLLEGRKSEYRIFGKTSQDAEYDLKIIYKIEQLKKKL